MRRAERLFQIVQLLRGDRLVTAQRLARRLEVSERTIYRDVAHLIGAGVPIDGAAGVGYLLRGGFDLPPLMFTRDEIVALVAGARILRAFGGAEMARAAEEALVKIDAVLPADLRDRARAVRIDAYSTVTDARLRAHIDLLERLADERLRAAFAYVDKNGEATERVVRPLALWFWGLSWTLIAWCELRQDFRMFRLDRMSAICAGAPFRTEPDKSLATFCNTVTEAGWPHGAP